MGYLTSPTVLVVDDQERYGERLKRALLDYGSIGAIFVKDLGEAARIIREKELHFDALLTDLSFDEGGENEELDLHDGLDLLAFAQRENPAMERYAYSAHVETSGFKTKVSERDINVKKFFDKRRIDLDSTQDADPDQQPWNVVRADIFRKRIESDPTLLQRLHVPTGQAIGEEGVLERLLSAIKPPTVTYLQRISSDYIVNIPIEVVCTPAADGTVRASAPKLGILVDGIGDTPAAAVEELRDIIATHCDALLSPEINDFSGYTELVRSELLRHLTPRQ